MIISGPGMNGGVVRQRNDMEWWLNFQVESLKLHRKYPTLGAHRKNDISHGRGEWTLVGPYLAQAKFRDMAAAAAEKCGAHGDKNLLVNWWLDHLNGDHVKKMFGQRDHEQLPGEVITEEIGEFGYRKEGFVDGQGV